MGITAVQEGTAALRGPTSVQATPSGIPSLPAELKDGAQEEGAVCGTAGSPSPRSQQPSCHVSGSFSGSLAAAVLVHRVSSLLPQFPYFTHGSPTGTTSPCQLRRLPCHWHVLQSARYWRRGVNKASVIPGLACRSGRSPGQRDTRSGLAADGAKLAQDQSERPGMHTLLQQNFYSEDPD